MMHTRERHTSASLSNHGRERHAHAATLRAELYSHTPTQPPVINASTDRPIHISPLFNASMPSSTFIAVHNYCTIFYAPPFHDAKCLICQIFARMSGMLDLSIDEKAKHFLPRWLNEDELEALLVANLVGVNLPPV